jgi:4'-phosphopantetheinyl transferase
MDPSRAGDRRPRECVDLWLVETGSPLGAEGDRLVATLSDDERARGRRFVRPEDARAYLLAHAMVRAALEWYLDGPAATWRFVEAPGGKPALSCSGPAVEFNLSHSRGVAACAFAVGTPVGVDVEPVTRGAEALALASRQFTTDERSALESCPAAERPELAVWLWTAKESVLKGCGRGLALPMAEVAIARNAAGGLDFASAATRDVGAWDVRRFRVGRTHVGAVAVPAGSMAKGTLAFEFRPGWGAPRAVGRGDAAVLDVTIGAGRPPRAR